MQKNLSCKKGIIAQNCLIAQWQFPLVILTIQQKNYIIDPWTPWEKNHRCKRLIIWDHYHSFCAFSCICIPDFPVWWQQCQNRMNTVPTITSYFMSNNKWFQNWLFLDVHLSNNQNFAACYQISVHIWKMYRLWMGQSTRKATCDSFHWKILRILCVTMVIVLVLKDSV